MSLIERNISEQADTVTRKLLDGQVVDQAEAVGLAQEVVRLSQQLAGAVEALKFYADPKTWDTISPKGTVTTNTLAKQDNGERARLALGGQS